MSFSSRFDLTETEVCLHPILVGKIPKPQTHSNIQPAFPQQAKQKTFLFPPVVSEHQDALITRSIPERQTIPAMIFENPLHQQSLFNTIPFPNSNRCQRFTSPQIQSNPQPARIRYKTEKDAKHPLHKKLNKFTKTTKPAL